MAKQSVLESHSSFLLRLLSSSILVGLITWLFFGVLSEYWQAQLAYYTLEVSAFMPEVVALVVGYFLVTKFLGGILSRLVATIFIAALTFQVSGWLISAWYWMGYGGFNTLYEGVMSAVAFALSAVVVVWAWRLIGATNRPPAAARKRRTRKA